MCSDEAYEEMLEMLEAGAFPEDPVAWAGQTLQVERMKELLLA